VPVLVNRLVVFVKRSRPSTLSAEELEKATGWELNELLAFADSRHAELLENFIAQKPALAPLNDNLAGECWASKHTIAEVRNRPAPPPTAEPPFRLDHKPPHTQ